MKIENKEQYQLPRLGKAVPIEIDGPQFAVTEDHKTENTQPAKTPEFFRQRSRRIQKGLVG